MPADRSRSKKASSSRLVLTDVKNNHCAITPGPARAIAFAPNVTPGTYLDTEGATGPYREHASPSDDALPTADTPAPAPSRQREPRGKSRSQDHIPRPANAFILFRSDFVKTKHPELANQGDLTLSKIIGDYWHGLVPEEKLKWEEKARVAKEQHSKKYPGYVFRPVHNKEKKAAKRKTKAGNELIGAVRRDTEQQPTASVTPESFSGVDQWVPCAPVHQPVPYYGGRTSSAPAPVPEHLYNPVRLPTIPFLPPSQPSAGPSCPASPVGNISHLTRYNAARRASGPRPSWTCSMEMQLPVHMPLPAPMPPTWQRDWSSVPQSDMLLFAPAYLEGGSNLSRAQNDYGLTACPPAQRHQLSLEIDRLDCRSLGMQGYSDIPPSALFPSAPSPVSAFSYHAPFAHGPTLETATSSNNGWMPTSGSTSALSGSPGPSAHAFSYALNAGLLAQQLDMEAQEQGFEGWMQQGQVVEPPQQPYDLGDGHNFSAQLQLQQYAMCLPVDDYARVAMGEPSGSGSGSGSQQGWYPNEE